MKRIFMIALAITGITFALASCDTTTGGNTNEDSELSGTITISPASGVTTGKELTAVYSGGSENVSYQWNKDDFPIDPAETGTTYTPAEAGSYTVTVHAAGYRSKTSAPVTVTAPIEINSLADLIAISAAADNYAGLRKNYKLTADITDVDTPIGAVSGGMFVPFTGDFDGNGHTVTLNITNGLVISSGPLAGTFAGLFAAAGELSGDPGTRGTVHDLTVTGTINITISADRMLCAGGVAGVLLPTASVSKVASSVNVSVSCNGHVNAGGIAGASQGTVSNVYATGDVSATTSGTDSVYAGGIAGGVSPGSTMSYAYAAGSISAAGTGAGIAAGEGKTTVGAGGIAGGASGAPVRYTVALNSSVSAAGDSYNRCSFRITSTSTGTVTTNSAANYGRSNLTPSGGSYQIDKGADQQDGVDLTVTGGPLPTAYTAPNETWWTNTGFSGADWNTVWQWDSEKGQPVLR
jgi:hypothetical protein